MLYEKQLKQGWVDKSSLKKKKRGFKKIIIWDSYSWSKLLHRGIEELGPGSRRDREQDFGSDMEAFF